MNDGFGGHLLAQVHNLKAVVGDDCLDQVLANVVHIAIHRRQHQFAFTFAGLLLEVIFQVRHGFFHHFCRLQHKWQDKLTRAKAVAHLFHGWQEYLIQDDHRGLAFRRVRVFGEDCLNVFFHPSLQSANDALRQAFSRGEPVER